MSSKQQTKIHVCFVGIYTYSLFNTKTQYKFGGAEVQTSLLSKGLARSSQFEVTYIVGNHNQPSRENFYDVTVIPHSRYTYPDWYKQIRNTRQTNQAVSIGQQIKQMIYRIYSITCKSLPDYIFYPKLNVYDYAILFNRFKRYIEVDADVYVIQTASDIAAEIAAFCKQYQKKLILILGSDRDLIDTYTPDNKENNIYGSPNNMCHYALMQADAIVAQTNYQEELLKDRFGRLSTVITNPIDLQEYFDEVPYLNRKIALWIGKSNKNKQPDVLIQLARQFPDIQFVMIMNRDDDIRSDQIINSAPDNVLIHEFVAYHEIESFFAKAFVFISTSSYEGFPNTFLQAGKYHVPILSYNVDPDNFVQTYECGIVAQGDFDTLANGLKTIHENKQVAQKYSENIYQYVETHHNLQQKVDQLEAIITSCLDE